MEKLLASIKVPIEIHDRIRMICALARKNIKAVTNELLNSALDAKETSVPEHLESVTGDQPSEETA